MYRSQGAFCYSATDSGRHRLRYRSPEAARSGVDAEDFGEVLFCLLVALSVYFVHLPPPHTSRPGGRISYDGHGRWANKRRDFDRANLTETSILQVDKWRP